MMTGDASSDMSMNTPKGIIKDVSESHTTHDIKSNAGNSTTTSSTKGVGKGQSQRVSGGHGTVRRPVTTGKHFMEWLNNVENHLEHSSDSECRDYVKSLDKGLCEINSLLDQVRIISNLQSISEEGTITHPCCIHKCLFIFS